MFCLGGCLFFVSLHLTSFPWTCGGLNKNGPICLNAWSPASGTVLGRIGRCGLVEDVALLEEVCHYGWALRFQKSTPVSLSLCFLSVDQEEVNSWLLLQHHA